MVIILKKERIIIASNMPILISINQLKEQVKNQRYRCMFQGLMKVAGLRVKLLNMSQCNLNAK